MVRSGRCDGLLTHRSHTSKGGTTEILRFGCGMRRAKAETSEIPNWITARFAPPHKTECQLVIFLGLSAQRTQEKFHFAIPNVCVMQLLCVAERKGVVLREPDFLGFRG